MGSKLLLIGVFLACFSSALRAEDGEGELISKYEGLLLSKTVSQEERSQIHYTLAQAYLTDQETDKAFNHFLAALQVLPTKQKIEITPDENPYYEEAYQFYISHAGADPLQTAQEMLARYEEIADSHPQYRHLNFLLAAADANLGKYSRFFERFYAAYPYLTDSFLAEKTQGILYLRLSQHGRLPEERHTYQEKALNHLCRALERNPMDASLYKVLIFLAKEEKNEMLILSCLRKMVEVKAAIPRADIYLFVREAVSLGEIDLGQQIVDNSRSLYEYSRAITAAQEYLNQHKDNNGRTSTR